MKGFFLSCENKSAIVYITDEIKTLEDSRGD